MSRSKLTARQIEALQRIYESVANRGAPPTLRELGRALGLSSDQAVIELLERLQRAGLIERDPRQARGISLTKSGYVAVGVPIGAFSGLKVSGKAFELTTTQQEVSKRLRDIDADLSKMYLGGLRVLLDESNPDRIAQSSHSMREITNHLFRNAQVLVSDEEKEQLKERNGSQARRLQKLFDPLGGIAALADSVYDVWNRFHKYFTAVSHHTETTEEEYRSTLDQFEEVLLRYVLPHQVEIYARLDLIIAKGPQTADSEEIKKLLSRNLETYRYFFTKVSATWLEFLRHHGLLKLSWPVADYFARVAPETPDLVTQALLGLALPDDRRIGVRFIQAANRMPLDNAVKIAKRVVRENWVKAPEADFFDRPLNELLEKLTSGRRYHEALQLADELLDVQIPPSKEDGIPTHRDVTGYIDDHEYREVLRTLGAVPEQELGAVLRLLIDKLHKAVALGLGKSEDDFSYIWRPATEEHEQNWGFGEVKDLLVSAIRDLLERYIAHLKRAVKGDLAGALDQLVDRVHQYSILSRLKIHIYRLYPNDFRPQIEGTILDKFDDLNVQHEYARLLDDTFPDLSDSVRHKYFDLVDVGSQEEDSDAYRAHWKIRKLAVIKRHLSGEQLLKYQKLLEGQAEPEHPDFLAPHSGVWVGPTAPTDKDSLASMSVEAVVELLRDWHPGKADCSPSRQGLGRVLAEAVKERAAEYSRQAETFAIPNVRPVYLGHFFTGLTDSIRNGTTIEWTPVINLAAGIVEAAKADRLPEFEKERNDFWESDWDDVFQAIARLLNDGLNQRQVGPTFGLRRQIWACLEYLCEHSDPTPEHERQYGGDNSDPFHLSINTVRGVAFHALFAYIFWCDRQLSSRKKSRSSRIPSEAKKVLEEHLEIEHEPSLTIRSVYGRYFPWLFLYDVSWARPLVDKVFPKDDRDRRYAVWEGYLTNAVFEEVYQALKPQYELAVAELRREKPKRKYAIDPTARLAEHVMIAYAYGIDRPDDLLYLAFFREASGKQRGMAVSFAGRAYIARDEVPPGDKLPDLERLQTFWEWRLSESSSVEELQEFGWWAKENRFDNRWMLEKLVDTLQKTKGIIDGDFQVIETLCALADRHPLLCARALDLIIHSSTSRRSFLWGHTDDIHKALMGVCKAGETEAKRLGVKSVDYLTKLGFETYRSILESPGFPVDEDSQPPYDGTAQLH